MKWEGLIIWFIILMVSLFSKQKPWRIGRAFWLGILLIIILEIFISNIRSSYDFDYIFFSIQFISALSMVFIIDKFSSEYEYIKKLKSAEENSDIPPTQSYIVESILNKLNNYPEYLLMIGLLGTFTSLLLVLSKIDFSGNVNSAEALSQLQGIIGLIGLKFKISIWGLIFATLLRVFPYHEAEEIVEHYLKKLEFKRKEIIYSSFANLLGNIESELKDIPETNSKVGKDVILKLNKVIDEINALKEQLRKLSDSTKKIESYNKKLSEEFLEKFHKAAENIKEASENLQTGSNEFKESAKSISMAISNFSDRTEQTMKDLKDTFTELIKNFNKNVKETLDKINSASNKLNEATRDLTQSVGNLQSSLNQSINNLNKSVNETFENFKEGVQSSLNDMSEKVSKTLEDQIQTINSMASKLEETTKNMSEELSNTLKTLNGYINQIATSYKEITKTFKKFKEQYDRILNLTDKVRSQSAELTLKLQEINEKQIESLDKHLKNTNSYLKSIEDNINKFMEIYRTQDRRNGEENQD